MFTCFKALLITSALVLSPVVTSAQEIPVETLFKRDEFRALILSPDGKKVAAISPYKGKFNLAVVDLEKNQLKRVTGFDFTDVNSYFWVGNERLVFSTGDQQGFDFRGNGAVYAINVDGSESRELNPPISAQAGSGTVAIRSFQPLRSVRGSDVEIFVSTNGRSATTSDVYRVNTKTGRKTLLTFDTPGFVRRWVLDANQIPRAAVVSEGEEMKSAFYYRADEKSPWTKMLEWGINDDEITPEAFDKNGVLYVTSNIGRDTKALYEYDTGDKKLGKLIFGDDRYDVTPPNQWGGLGSYGFLRFASEEDLRLVGVTYVADKPKTIWLDEKYKNMQAELDKSLPDTLNIFGLLREKMLVTATSDRDAGTIYLFDRSKPSLTELVRVAEWIKPKDMNQMRPITYTARDGMRIDGYLTLPKAWKKGSPVPMIVHPHGGPWARDVWGFNPEIQFMANRGYAVLQMDFRNSTGYGKKLYRAGWKQWGEKAQDDILDGVMWAIKEGYADKDKIGIYGASYGGYSVLMQLVRNPELYKFGFNYVGVTDMLVHRDTQRFGWAGGGRKFLDILNGDPKTDQAMLERTSPARFVNNIKAPVMHAYGGADINVDIANGNEIKKAFEKAGLPVDYTFVVEEGHGYQEDKNRFMLYKKFDEFMKKNMPVK